MPVFKALRANTSLIRLLINALSEYVGSCNQVFSDANDRELGVAQRVLRKVYRGEQPVPL